MSKYDSSASGSLPNNPLAKDLSNVAILLVRMSDGFRSPLTVLGVSGTSVVSCQLTWDVIKQTVKSKLVSASTTAGLSLLLLRSVNGKVINTISPLAIVNHFQIISGVKLFLATKKIK